MGGKGVNCLNKSSDRNRLRSFARIAAKFAPGVSSPVACSLLFGSIHAKPCTKVSPIVRLFHMKAKKLFIFKVSMKDSLSAN